MTHTHTRNDTHKCAHKHFNPHIHASFSVSDYTNTSTFLSTLRALRLPHPPFAFQPWRSDFEPNNSVYLWPACWLETHTHVLDPVPTRHDVNCWYICKWTYWWQVWHKEQSSSDTTLSLTTLLTVEVLGGHKYDTFWTLSVADEMHANMYKTNGRICSRFYMKNTEQSRLFWTAHKCETF